MRDTIAACERAGYADGLAAGLALAMAGVAADAAPGEIAAVPSTAVPAGTTVVHHDIAARQGISFVRPGSRTDIPRDQLTAFAARLGAVRLGVTRRLVEQVVDHLSGRVVDGEPTVRKQLVQGALADAQVATEAARRCLLVAGHICVAVTDVHDRLTTLDWEMAKLLGASGYVGEGRASGAFVSRLTANCWIVREGAA
jgi:hypothetical protein